MSEGPKEGPAPSCDCPTCQCGPRNITFKAEEAAEITGVNQALQRLWRSRDLLTKVSRGNQAQMSVEQLAKMAVLGVFSRSKIEMKPHMAIIDDAARLIAAQACGETPAPETLELLPPGSPLTMVLNLDHIADQVRAAIDEKAARRYSL